MSSWRHFGRQKMAYNCAKYYGCEKCIPIHTDNQIIIRYDKADGGGEIRIIKITRTILTDDDDDAYAANDDDANHVATTTTEQTR